MPPSIEIVPYREAWAAEFRGLGASLRLALGAAALRIDHIGSTAVPGLAAKDVIDVQVSVAALGDARVPAALESLGAEDTGIGADHAPRGLEVDGAELRKRVFVLLPPHRRANVHVREAGRFNHEYALLCRDYLRFHPDAAAAYAEIKLRLAKHFPRDKGAYDDLKDPVFDVLMAAAREWARWTRWTPGAADA